MRFPKLYVLLITAVAVNFAVFLYIYNIQESLSGGSARVKKNIKKLVHDLSRSSKIEELVTVILRDFEEYENDLESVISHLLKAVPNITVVALADRLPYPPVKLPKSKNVFLMSNVLNPTKSLNDYRPERLITTEYTLVLPDTAMIESVDIFKRLLRYFKTEVEDDVKSVGVEVGDGAVTCQSMVVDVKRWTLKQHEPPAEEGVECDGINGLHALFLKSNDFLSLSSPFMRPQLESLHLQMAARGWETHLLKDTKIKASKTLFKEPHNLWKYRFRQSERRKQMYKDMGIKLIQHADGEMEWMGCEKASARCFGTVVNDMPSYIYNGRWTPPCCLRALRETVRYVFDILDDCEVRYWLEGGSLLGAARHKDIIPWDYDVDVGIYKDDIAKCEPLAQCLKSPFVDEQGFKWEKAIEGEFYRVQYSEYNHMHVDIFPFYSKNGIMTKDTWLKGHKQDMEFPEHFLIPLQKAEFAGVEAPVPNNMRKFLEYKFGPGVIENPRFPNGQNVTVGIN